jgi:hypothetical protein
MVACRGRQSRASWSVIWPIFSRNFIFSNFLKLCLDARLDASRRVSNGLEPMPQVAALELTPRRPRWISQPPPSGRGCGGLPPHPVGVSPLSHRWCGSSESTPCWATIAAMGLLGQNGACWTHFSPSPPWREQQAPAGAGVGACRVSDRSPRRSPRIGPAGWLV